MTDLSCRQRCYVDRAGTQSVLIARPGSGKTRAGIARFLARIQKRERGGVAYLSFTNVAVDEASQRAAQAGSPATIAAPNTVETLDGFIRTHLFDPFASTYFGATIENVRIIDEMGGVLGELTSNALYQVFGIEAYGVGAWSFDAVVVGTNICFERKSGPYIRSPIDAKYTASILKAKRAYVKAGYATYNDIAMWSLTMLRDGKTRTGEIVSRRYPEIIVDEAQDTSSVHQQILFAIERAGSEIAYIGDPDQSIYEFNDASPAFLEELAASRERWDLTTNFRSSDKIVAVVRSHFGQADMEAARTCAHPDRGCFVTVMSAEDALPFFESKVEAAQLSKSSSVVVTRSQAQLRDLLREGTLKDFAPAIRRVLLAWQRERNGKYKFAARDAANFLRAVMDTGADCDIEPSRWTALAWTFLRSYVPMPGPASFADWVDELKEAVNRFADEKGLKVRPKIGSVLKKSGLPSGSAADYLLKRPVGLRTSTIHGVKGESISAVMVVGSASHHRSWLALDDDEMKALGYVAFTRAEDLLLLVCPTEALAREWVTKGFVRI